VANHAFLIDHRELTVFLVSSLEAHVCRHDLRREQAFLLNLDRVSVHEHDFESAHLNTH
jgi:hypothetical protein